MNCEIFVDPYDGHFTFDYQRFNSGGPGLEIPRWQGTPADNKLGALTPPPRARHPTGGDGHYPGRLLALPADWQDLIAP